MEIEGPELGQVLQGWLEAVALNNWSKYELVCMLSFCQDQDLPGEEQPDKAEASATAGPIRRMPRGPPTASAACVGVDRDLMIVRSSLFHSH